MKRLLTLGTSVLVIVVGGSMLATPASAATAGFTCSEAQLQEAQAIAEEYCGGRFSEAYATCYSSDSPEAPATMMVETTC